MRVNTLLIASLTGAAYALPLQTAETAVSEHIPRGSIVEELEGLTKLPVGRRQTEGLTGPLNALAVSNVGGLQKSPLGQVTDLLPGSTLGGLKKRQLGAATNLINELQVSDLSGLGKRQLEQVTDKLDVLSLGGLKTRGIDLEELPSNKLNDLDILSNEKRQLEQVTDKVADLSLLGLVRRQLSGLTSILGGVTGPKLPTQAGQGLPLVGGATNSLPIVKRALPGSLTETVTDTVHSLTGRQLTPLNSLLGGLTGPKLPTQAGQGLPLAGGATNSLPIVKRALLDTTELTSGTQLKSVTDKLHNAHLPALAGRQLEAVTGLLSHKTLPIAARD